MASRTLLEPGRETRRRDETVPARREHAPAAAPARRAGRTDRGGLHAHRRVHRDRRGRRAAARPRPRRRAVPRAGRARRRAARLARRRDPRGAPHGDAPAVARGDAAGPARALDAGTVGRRRHRAAELLPHLHGLPEPEGAPAAAAPGRPLRPPARRPRPRDVRRPRPRRPAAHDPRRRGLDARPLDRLRGVHRVPAAVARRRARLLARHPGRPVLRDRAVGQLGPGRRELLPAALAGADLLRAGGVRPSPAFRGDAAPGHAARPARRVPPAPHHRHAPGDRGVRVAAHLDEPDRRDRGAPARARAAAEDRAVGLARPHDPRPPSTSAGTTSSTTSPAWGSPSGRCWSPAR